jgi:hypothetical protein
MPLHEICAELRDWWIRLAEPNASVQLGCRRELHCHTRLRFAFGRRNIGHSARWTCRKQSYSEHGRSAISSGPPRPANTLIATPRGILPRWRWSALRMPRHWMLPRATVQPELFHRRHSQRLVNPSGNTEVSRRRRRRVTLAQQRRG